MTRIAHFSDFHLQAEDDQFEAAIGMVAEAVEKGADHLVISGDVVDCADLSLYKLFLNKAARIAGPGNISIVPGNHDIFPLSTSTTIKIPFTEIPLPVVKPLHRPTTLFKNLCHYTRKFRGNSRSLIPGFSFPFATKIARDVALVGVDTTKCDSYDPRLWAAGELNQEAMNAVSSYFRRSKATHKVLVMHHTPWEEEVHHGWVKQNFVDPHPEEVLKWIRDCGATLVLCGHIHCSDAVEVRRIGQCKILRCGASGSHDEPGIHLYHLIDCYPDGKVKIKKISFAFP